MRHEWAFILSRPIHKASSITLQRCMHCKMQRTAKDHRDPQYRMPNGLPKVEADPCQR